MIFFQAYNAPLGITPDNIRKALSRIAPGAQYHSVDGCIHTEGVRVLNYGCSIHLFVPGKLLAWRKKINDQRVEAFIKDLAAMSNMTRTSITVFLQKADLSDCRLTS